MSDYRPFDLAQDRPFGMAQDKFCPKCGAELELQERHGHQRQVCPRCGFILYRNPIVGVAVLLTHGDRVLLSRRARGEYRGLWDVPGGYVEWGEDVRDAARRELLEETSLTVEIGPVFNVYSNFHNPESLTVGVWFRGTVLSGALTPGDDVEALDYFPFGALPPLAFPTDRLVLEELWEEMS